MTSKERLLQESCRAAAKDLGVDVTSPFTVIDAHGEGLAFIAHFQNFGSDTGVLICHADEWMAKNAIAASHGYYCSGLHPDSYSRYDRRLWIETFDEWGWRGPDEGRPTWCRG